MGQKDRPRITGLGKDFQEAVADNLGITIPTPESTNENLHAGLNSTQGLLTTFDKLSLHEQMLEAVKAKGTTNFQPEGAFVKIAKIVARRVAQNCLETEKEQLDEAGIKILVWDDQENIENHNEAGYSIYIFDQQRGLVVNVSANQIASDQEPDHPQSLTRKYIDRQVLEKAQILKPGLVNRVINAAANVKYMDWLISHEKPLGYQFEHAHSGSSFTRRNLAPHTERVRTTNEEKYNFMKHEKLLAYMQLAERFEKSFPRSLEHLHGMLYTIEPGDDSKHVIVVMHTPSNFNRSDINAALTGREIPSMFDPFVNNQRFGIARINLNLTLPNPTPEQVRSHQAFCAKIAERLKKQEDQVT